MHLWYDTIYLLTASGLPPGGSCTIHIYTQTIHRTAQNKQYIEQHKIWEQYKIATFMHKMHKMTAKESVVEFKDSYLLLQEQKIKENSTNS